MGDKAGEQTVSMFVGEQETSSPQLRSLIRIFMFPPAIERPSSQHRRQIAAFEAGDEDWWRYGVDFVAYAKNEFGDWAPIEDQDEGHAGGTSGPQ